MDLCFADSACGLRISNEAVGIAIGLRFGLIICDPHSCPCGGVVDAKGIHGPSCKLSAGRSIRHLKSTILSTQSRRSVYQRTARFAPGEDKLPDGLTLVPWQGGRCLAWDATVVDTLAPSYVAASAQVTGSAAQAAVERIVSKYAGLPASHIFIPIAIETYRPYQ